MPIAHRSRCISSSLRTLAACGLVLGAAHCGDANEVNDVVNPGDSIQAAVDRIPATADHWVIQVRPGVYKESVDITRSGVELRGVVEGEDRPILDGTMDGGMKRKDGMVVSGAYFTISGFLVRNYAGNGITSQKTHDTTFRNVITDSAGKYGLYPVESERILIENCVATNIADAGIYVGQSKDAIVRGCVAHGNVAGIEIENTVGALVENNEAYDNAGGILVFLLPGGASKMASDCEVVNNNVHDNNHVNFGDPNTTVAKVPQGMGILVMAADRTLVQGNRITGNQSVGITIASATAIAANPGDQLDIEPNSDETNLVNNIYKNNGRAPSPQYFDLVKDYGITKGGDLLFDGTGKKNCIEELQEDELVTQGIPLPRC